MKVSIPDTFVRENGNDIIGGFVIRNIGTGIALASPHQSFIFKPITPPHSRALTASTDRGGDVIL